MKIYDCEQGSPEWIALRLGMPTASEFDKIVTPKKLEMSASTRDYAIRLIAEKALGRPMMALDNLEWVERGKLLEPQARRVYEFEHDVITTRVGFITTDDGRFGASPDSLICDDGVLELKCPAPHTHLKYVLNEELAPEYYLQVQGQMFVAERDYADLVSFSDEMPMFERRVARDDRVISKLSNALNDFHGLLGELTERARKAGMFVAKEKRVATPVDAMAAEYGE